MPDTGAQTISLGAENASTRPEGNGAGILRLKSEQSHVTSDLIEENGTDHAGLIPGRFVLTILVLAIIFIIIITWFISKMPER
jgi:hypothetical protein